MSCPYISDRCSNFKKFNVTKICCPRFHPYIMTSKRPGKQFHLRKHSPTPMSPPVKVLWKLWKDTSRLWCFCLGFQKMALTGDWQVLNGITRSLKLSLRSCGSSLWHSGRWLSLMPVSCKKKAAWFFHSQKKRDSWFGKMDQTSATKNGGSRMWTHQTREINQKMPTTSSEDFGIWTDGRFWFSRSWRLQDQREVSYSRFFACPTSKMVVL